MGSELQELIDFLKPGGNPQVRSQALDIVESLTGSPEGISSLRGSAKPLFAEVFKCVGVVSLARPALTALVNASQDPVVCEALLELGAINRSMDYMRDNVTAHHDLLLMLLSNLTQTDDGARKMLQLGEGSLECHNMHTLLSLVVNPSASMALYEHVAGVLCNVTRLEGGRRALLSHGAGLFQALGAMLCSSSEVMKRGAASTLKNLCVSAEKDGTMGTILSEKALLRQMLVPINGEEPIERDDVVRENLAQAIALIARSDAGVTALYELNAQEILRKGFEYEEHPAVMEAMQATARLFMAAGGGDAQDAAQEDAAAAPGMVIMG